jgi:hypothetical protein
VGGSEQGHDATSTHAATMKNVFFFVGGFHFSEGFRDDRFGYVWIIPKEHQAPWF